MPTRFSSLSLRDYIITNLRLSLHGQYTGIRFGIVVRGLPGGYKTRLTLESLTSIYRILTRYRIPVVIAEPTRALRDYCVRIALERLHSDDIVVFRSKSEICPTYKERIYEIYKTVLRKVIEDIRYAEQKLRYGKIFGTYLISILAELYARYKICSECSQRPNCEFYQNLRQLASRQVKMYFVTHRLLQILVHMTPKLFRRCIIVIDEVDQYLDVFRQVMTREHLRVLEKLAKFDPAWNRVVKAIENQLVGSEVVGIYFLKPAIPKALLPILISATVDIDDIYFAYEVFAKQRIHFDVYTVSVKMLDKCVLCNNIIYMVGELVEVPKHVTVLKPEEAAKRLAKIAVELVNHGLKVGIASRSYDFTQLLAHELSQYGVKFFSDVKYRKSSVDIREVRERLQTADILIWTTRGKLSRGISFPDCNVIICTYQAAEIVRPTIHIFDYVLIHSEDIEDEEIRTFIRKICDAHNVQSFFRANRNRDMKHIFLFADKRAWEAMLQTFKPYARESRTFKKWYESELQRPRITDLKRSKNVVETVLSLV